MNREINIVVKLLLILMLTISMTMPVSSKSDTGLDDAVSCHKINAKGIGQDLGGGKTQANILGGGLLHGTTEGNFIITGFADPVASFEGTIKFTTRHGTLTVAVKGTLDTATGEFSASGPVTGATEKLAGAIGTLNFNGVEDLKNGNFVEDVTGSICIDLSKE